MNGTAEINTPEACLAEAKRLSDEADAINEGAEYADDPSAYRSEREAAWRLLAQADALRKRAEHLRGAP